LSIDTIRTLSIDAVQQAKSGHPAAPWKTGRFATKWTQSATLLDFGPIPRPPDVVL